MRDLTPYIEGLDLSKFALIIKSKRGKLLFVAKKPTEYWQKPSDYYSFQCALTSICRGGGQPKTGMFYTARQVLAQRSQVEITGTLAEEFKAEAGI